MEEKIYTLSIRQTGTYQYEVTVAAIGATKTAPTLDSALTITLNDILKHLMTRSLILVFADHHAERGGRRVDLHERPQTDREYKAAFEVTQLGVAPQVNRRERHLVLELSCPLTLEQAIWLDEYPGKLFDRYHNKDELEGEFDTLREEVCENRKTAAHE